MFSEYELKNLLISRDEIEKVLGVKINLTRDDDEQYIEDYAMHEWLNIHVVVCIFLKIHPQNINAEQHPRYDIIYNALKNRARNATNENNIKIEQEFDINGNEIYFNAYFSHDFARAWAKTYGLNWNVPPFKGVQLSNKVENSDNLQTQLEQARAEIAELKKQLEELQAKILESQIVNNEDQSIHGHTSEGVSIIFEVSKKIAEKCDPENLHSYSSKENVIDYVTKYFSDSNKLAEAVYQIVIPNKVKDKGRPPKGVETFKGFI